MTKNLMTKNDFSCRLTALRTKAGLSITELAGLSGLARTAIHKLENGERKPSFGTVQKLAKALRVKITAFQG